MFQIALERHDDLDGFRRMVRSLLARGANPDQVFWSDTAGAGLLAALPSAEAPPVLLPAAYRELADWVICHRDVARLDRLYRLAWRLTHGERALLQVPADPLVFELQRMRKAVTRDRHKMTAFVRFRQVGTGDDERFLAWFEPEHHILHHVAPFFADRFASMRWGILTPLGSIRWDREELTFGPPCSRTAVPDSDALDAWWQSYYAATFNPARANVPAMLTEMPKRYWHNLPEAKLIPGMLAKAQDRQRTMLARAAEPALQRKEPLVATPGTIESLEDLAAGTQACIRCPLYRHATQAVPGRGEPHAELMLVGEQPGDQEDLAGLPFIGPAGQMLDQALGAAGLDRDRLYVTNAVKHFKFEPRGKRRIHMKPNNAEIEQCRWWLEEELALVRPKLVVALGATAARALLGRPITIGKERGRVTEFGEGRKLLVTVHPSYLLRLPDPEMKALEYAKFTADLAVAAAAVPQARRAA